MYTSSSSCDSAGMHTGTASPPAGAGDVAVVDRVKSVVVELGIHRSSLDQAFIYSILYLARNPWFKILYRADGWRRWQKIDIVDFLRLCII